MLLLYWLFNTLGGRDLLLGQIRDSQAAGLLVTHSRVAARRADRVLELGVQGLVDITERA